MAKVLVVVKVLPEDVETPIDELRNRITGALPEGYELKMWEEEPIAFGLKALRLAIVMPEETEGGTEQLETLLSQVPGVSQVEVEYVNRLS